MLEVLKLFNYTPPIFDIKYDKNTTKFGPTGINKTFEIEQKERYYRLLIKGEQWMMYENDNHHQASQLFSHYYLAFGNVIVTGLGLGIREKWILNNKNVKSLTILEINTDIIEYHKEINPILFKNAKIINCDAKTYKGKCDTLLLDHYENEDIYNIINDVKNICDNNIKCNKMWFWPLEVKIIADLHNVNENIICDLFRNKNFKLNINNLKQIKYYYDLIKSNNKLDKLPELTLEELQLIISIYTHFFQKL